MKVVATMYQAITLQAWKTTQMKTRKANVPLTTLKKPPLIMKSLVMLMDLTDLLAMTAE